MWNISEWKISSRIGLGLFTALPVMAAFAIPLDAILRPETGIAHSGTVFATLFLAVPMLFFVLLILYVPALFANTQIDKRGRVLWLAAFVFVAPFALPIYWFVHIWSAGPATGSFPKDEPRPT